MLDWTTVKIPCLHSPLPVGKTMKVDPAGEVEWIANHRMSVQGSYDQTVSIKSMDINEVGEAQILHVSGNFAKFLQGHNIFGTDDIIKLVFDGLTRLAYIIEAEQGIDLLSKIDWEKVSTGHYEVDRVDINYMFSLPSGSDVNSWLRNAEYSSHTRHGRPRNSKGTVYWGQNSRRWSLKAYNKAEEIKVHGSKIFELDRFKPLKDLVQNMLRMELTLRQLELRKLNIKYAYQLTTSKVNELYTSYLGRLEMAEKFRLSDDQVLKLPARLAGTYQLWNSGYVPFDILSRPTFYRHRKQLLEFGIDISNPPPQAVSNVVPLIRVIEAKPVVTPDWVIKQGLVIAA